jgi:hypothetical protein
MYIGLKDGHIVVFGASLADLETNAAVRGIVLDGVEETDEQIVPYHNTENDGWYFKASQVPPCPADIVNFRISDRRRELYAAESDPLTNNIAVLKDRIDRHDYESDGELQDIAAEVEALYQQRKTIRGRIVADNPFVE